MRSSMLSSKRPSAHTLRDNKYNNDESPNAFMEVKVKTYNSNHMILWFL